MEGWGRGPSSSAGVVGALEQQGALVCCAAVDCVVWMLSEMRVAR